MRQYACMAFSSSDLTNIEAAMVSFAVDGFATVTVGGQTVAVKSLDELTRLRNIIRDELTAVSDRPGAGLRFQQINPVYR